MRLRPGATAPSGSDRRIGYVLVAGLAALAIVLLGSGTYNVQVYLATLGVVLLLAVPLVRRAVRAEPAMPARFLWTALALKIAGSLARYTVLSSVYGGIGDATGYHGAGVRTYQLVRHLDFSFLHPPYVGTNAIDYLTGFVYAVTGPSIAAGFLLYAMASFVGQWSFYRAFRTAFPEGDHLGYAALVFFLPSMLFWPSSIGKDAIMVLGLGTASFGLARVLRGIALRPVFAFAAGTTVVAIVRPPVAVALVAAAGLAYLLQPSHTRDLNLRAVAWIAGIPVLLVVCGFLLLRTAHWLRIEGTADAFARYELVREGLNKGGSGFTPPPVDDPVGLAKAVGTVLVRPFPWEVGSVLGALAGLEGIGLGLLLLWRWRSVVNTVGAWRRNGMAVYATAMTVAMIGLLTGFTNFGLLVRQRTSLLPFLVMLPTAGTFAALTGFRWRGAEAFPRTTTR